MSETTYTFNLLGLVSLPLAIVILAGALGGSDFERGVASMLVLSSSEFVSMTFTGDDPFLRPALWLLAPVSGAILIVSLIMMVSGLS